MRILCRNILLLVCCHTASVAVAAEPPEIGTTENGLYHQRLDAALSYKVDTVTQLCFVAYIANGSLAPINCINLAKRKEWEPILTWVTNKPNY